MEEAETPGERRWRGGAPASISQRIQRRRAIFAKLAPFFTFYLPYSCLLAAHILLLLLPLPLKPFRTPTYVDENALQPAQASLFWGWDEVHVADGIAEKVSQLALTGANSTTRAEALQDIFTSYGIPAFTQSYSYPIPTSIFASSSSSSAPKHVTGTNTYALFRSPRTDGREAMLLTASWKSRWNGHDDPDIDLPKNVASQLAAQGTVTPVSKEGEEGSYEKLVQKKKRVNVRGIASVVALSKYLSRWLHHSKDIIFVISDGHLEGMQAWASAYFNDIPSTSAAHIEELHPSTLGRRIWTSISLDYPSDSFSTLALLHEGTNAGSPNMDVLNTVVRVAEHLPGSGSVPTILHGALSTSPLMPDGREPQYGEVEEGKRRAIQLARRMFPSFLLRLAERFLWGGEDGTAAYILASKALLTQFRHMASSLPSGPHGLLHKYRIDAFTLYAVPAKGPFGFFHLGRTVEGTLRSFSNLVERLHHSQFFYLLTDEKHFIQLPMYIVVPVLLGVGMTIVGLTMWTREGSEVQKRREQVGRAYQEWLDQMQTSEKEATREGPIPEPDQVQAVTGARDPDESLIEVEDLLHPAGTRKSASTSRKSVRQRTRPSAVPEPLQNNELSAPREKEPQELDGNAFIYDIPPEHPTQAQLYNSLAQQTFITFQSLTPAAGKLIRKGHVADILLDLRRALARERRPVAEALGVMAWLHVCSIGLSLGILAYRLDRCAAGGEKSGVSTSCLYRDGIALLALQVPLLTGEAIRQYRHRHRVSATSSISPFSTTTPAEAVGVEQVSETPTLTSTGGAEQRSPEERAKVTAAKEHRMQVRIELARLGRLLYVFALLYAGMLVSVLSVLNFALATSIGLALAIPLCFLRPSPPSEALSSILAGVGRFLLFLLCLNPAVGVMLAVNLLRVLDLGTVKAGVENVWLGWRLWGNASVEVIGGLYQAIVWQAAIGSWLVMMDQIY
ncbi:dolichyl-P-Man:Man(5)GlcNAc(2)-PP-dolichol alpha-1,3-mannosyltransferase [Tilletia horrida]|uniref:Dolichyl-P-Man:Man(5)GlcNAc(2)-PP-dolichol alpha-1,3-mannosyltransferase n=1 Tax=Tilletia horrida TaxID=155126 RepID=A0AAN6GPK9_9BASI|nr:dolichyl-P-Man:Man(5)GlcNAc(2)-PP-dolichol alpha-1,3-mannosyltransferase [Tilletia horrida]KAK0563091.1 dolichyl-P-Man:Man(5)GlcNAc(2)-PP-dolichol alpha-1,3-mannosyltransferase [Tilletia horrida]